MFNNFNLFVRKVLPAAAIMLLLAGMAFGDWVPEDGHKMHYPQFPDEVGWDVNATQPVILADDWRCSETGWVKDIHFWGSWRHEDEGQIIQFVLSIHDDIPADPPVIPYSRPGVTRWEREISDFSVVAIDPPAMEGWYDPASGEFFPDDHQAYFQYNVFLDSVDWFWQDSGAIYWLNISAIIADPVNTQWGWKSTLDHWNDDAVWAFWGELQWIDLWEPPDFIQSLDLAFVMTGGESVVDTCEYYKPPYQDYSPQGMPDFDQKQAGWNDAAGWTHCGPAAVADCMWWFDSKFEPSPVDPRPFGVVPPNDGYPLVMAYGAWDDHDPNNVQPLVNALAGYMNTNTGMRGTFFNDLVLGTRQFINDAGVAPDFKDSIQPAPDFDFIKEQVLDCQDVILLLTFYESVAGGTVCPIGGHYVTVAGVCTTGTRICISDPYYDALEGEPPAGSAHGGMVHNDADNISGPHAQIQHDPYDISMQVLPGGGSPVAVLPGYPITTTDLMQFEGQNSYTDPCPYGGGPVFTVIDVAYVICPDTATPTGACCDPATGNCNIATEDSCNAVGWMYQGDGTSCVPNPCQAPTGACCDPTTGNCSIMTADTCTNIMGWNYMGDGTSCVTVHHACQTPARLQPAPAAIRPPATA